jgi:Protein of unknown function (DUF3040)
MSLSEHEQRVLEEIEQSLTHEDPALAGRMASHDSYRRARRLLVLSVCGFVVGVVVMIAFFTTSVAVGFLGAVMMLVAADIFWTSLRRVRGVDHS